MHTQACTANILQSIGNSCQEKRIFFSGWFSRWPKKIHHYRHISPLKRVASPNGAAGWSQPFRKFVQGKSLGAPGRCLCWLVDWLTGWLVDDDDDDDDKLINWLFQIGWWWWWSAFQSLPGNSWKLGHWLYFLRSDTASTTACWCIPAFMSIPD